jgi:hypothetical protein
MIDDYSSTSNDFKHILNDYKDFELNLISKNINLLMKNGKDENDCNYFLLKKVNKFNEMLQNSIKMSMEYYNQLIEYLENYIDFDSISFEDYLKFNSRHFLLKRKDNGILNFEF